MDRCSAMGVVTPFEFVGKLRMTPGFLVSDHGVFLERERAQKGASTLQSVWDLWLRVLGWEIVESLVRKECNENLATELARSTGSTLGHGWGLVGSRIGQ